MTTLPHPRGVVQQTKALRGLMSAPCPALDELSRELGPTFNVGGGPMRMTIVGDPAHLRELLTTSTDAFRWGHKFNVLEFIVGPSSIIVSDGDEHRRRRSFVQPGFARRRLDGWIPLIVNQTDAIVGELPTDTSFDFYEYGRTLVRRVVIEVLFGHDFGARADDFGAVLEPAMTYGVQPALRQLPHPIPGTRRARARAARAAADRMIDAEIARRRRAAAPESDDLLDTLIAKTDDGELTDREVRDQVVTLVAAGYDTTASAIAWTLLRAVSTPGVWDALRAEADRVFAAAEPATFDAATFRDLTYADAVVRESLRIHPPGVFSPREAMRDVQLGEFTVRKGTMILWSPYIAGRLPEVWDDPLTFRPDRFVDPNEGQQAAIDAAWLPFGKGTRSCIGFALAHMELVLAIARLAQRVDLTRTTDDIPPPVGMVVNRPEGGVVVRASRPAGR